MQTVDSEYLRVLLKNLFPGLVIEEVLKESGQRVVYFAHFKEGEALIKRQVSWGKIVLKATEELTAKQIAYLQKEIDILHSLKSPYYPKLLFHKVYSQNPITEERLKKRLFVTIEERLDAKPLSDVRNRFIDEKSVLGLLEKLVIALSLLWKHESKLVHRDIKPENILIYENGEVAIIDLGIIREEGAVGLTLTHAPWGPCSPPYASPEQAKNDKKNILFKSDFFSLGILAYELISGKNPFITDPDISNDEILENICQLKPPTLISLGKATAGVSNLIEKLMSKEPYQRHRTIDQLLRHIQAVWEEFS